MIRRVWALVAVLALVGCSATPAGPEARREAVDALAVGLWAPAHEELATLAADLERSVQDACSSADEAALSAARDAWLATSDGWARMRAIRIGPVRELRLAGTMRFEIDPGKVDELAAEAPDVERLRNVGADVKGLDAIEHLLFAEAPLDPAACEYAAGLATLVREATDEMAAGWQTYPDELAEMGAQDGLDMAVNELIFALRELEMDHLAPAAGMGQPGGGETVEGRSAHGAATAAAMARGAQAAYLGTEAGSLTALVADASADADERVRSALDELVELLDGAGESWTEVEAATVERALELAADARVTLTTEVASLLGVTISLGDSDGDS